MVTIIQLYKIYNIFIKCDVKLKFVLSSFSIEPFEGVFTFNKISLHHTRTKLVLANIKRYAINPLEMDQYVLVHKIILTFSKFQLLVKWQFWVHQTTLYCGNLHLKYSLIKVLGFGGSGLHKGGDYCIINMVITQLPQGKKVCILHHQMWYLLFKFFILHSIKILKILLKLSS